MGGSCVGQSPSVHLPSLSTGTLPDKRHPLFPQSLELSLKPAQTQQR